MGGGGGGGSDSHGGRGDILCYCLDVLELTASASGLGTLKSAHSFPDAGAKEGGHILSM